MVELAAVEEVTAAPRCDLGEGPMWDERRGELVWVDIPAGLMHVLAPARGALRTLPVGQLVSAVLPDGDGWLLCTELGFETRSRDWSVTAAANVLDSTDQVRMNDAAIDARGRCYGGTLSKTGEEGKGIFFRLDPDGAFEVLERGVGNSNGVAWSPDARWLYRVDSDSRIVWRHSYEPDTGALGDGEIFHEIDRPAVPDGLTVDVDGGVWVALWDGGCVVRLDADGRLDRRFDLPVRRPTSLVFAGPDRQTVYITSARDDAGEGGELWQARASVPGLATPSSAAYPRRLTGLTS